MYETVPSNTACLQLPTALLQDAYSTTVKVYDTAPKKPPTYVEVADELRPYHVYSHR